MQKSHQLISHGTRNRQQGACLPHSYEWGMRRRVSSVNFEFIYGGMINMTMNFRPLMVQKHPSVYASASGEGAGVAKTCLMGHYVAEWINGIDSEELRFLRRIATPSHLPPEPLVTIGATVRLMWEEFNAKTEI